MNIIFLDHETTVQWLDGDRKDNTPFHPDNRLVSTHWRTYFNDELSEPKRAVFYHKEQQEPDSPDELIADLKKADMLVCHNLKFDLLWSRSVGFPTPPKTYCTMIGEYVLARGQGYSVSLEESAKRRKVTLKKSELIHDMFHKQKIGFERIPLDLVVEYGDGDVLSLAEIYFDQVKEYQLPSNYGLIPTVNTMNDNLHFLVEIEENGMKIKGSALTEVENEFKQEKQDIERRLDEIVREVMGDTPINLNSGAQMSWIVYSRRVNDRDKHIKMFNIGTNKATGKPLYRKRMSNSQFVRAVRSNTSILKRTHADHCEPCKGYGKVRKVKVDGTPYKNETKCTNCNGLGVTLHSTGKTAGLRLSPSSNKDATANGFATDKETLKRLRVQAYENDNLLAVEFIEKMVRLNAVSSYLSTFVDGIKRWVRPNGILNTNFNQCTTKTGRLSSSNPNFQNLPKEGKFPIRKALVSRFEGGSILEVDYSGLEFAVAGELSRCPVIMDHVRTNKNIHKQTSSITEQIEINAVTKDQRQDAKKWTFRPIYGGTGAGELPHIQKYFREFFKIYYGLGEWQRKVCDQVVATGIVRIPSGREYKFKNVRRLSADRVTNQTNIVNYPVQGFATGDIVPIACIRAHRLLKKSGLKSLAVLTVHDSLVFDVYPGEEQAVLALAHEAMDVRGELKRRYNYDLILDLSVEAEIGPNWMQTEVLELEKDVKKVA